MLSKLDALDTDEAHRGLVVFCVRCALFDVDVEVGMPRIDLALEGILEA